jgi:hypothetical protein
MPLIKYYCDYCDRYFNDNLTTRQKHFQSKAHIQAKQRWYQKIEQEKNDPKKKQKFDHQKYELAPDFVSFSTLPPSLQLPPNGGYSLEEIDKTTWG